MLTVADPVPVTAGSPYSRQTIAAWLIIPPMSVTTAAIRPNTGPHDGAVIGATRISPSWIAETWSARRHHTRACPRPLRARPPCRSARPSVSSPTSHCPTRSVVMPHSMIVNGSVIDLGRLVHAPAAAARSQRRHDLPRRAISAGQWTGPRLGADRPAVAVVKDRRRDLVAAQHRRCPRRRPEARVREHLAELAHLAPEHRQRPVLDVEVVVLDVGEHRRDSPSFSSNAALRRRRRAAARGTREVIAVALGGDRRLSAARCPYPACSSRDVVAHEPSGMSRWSSHTLSVEYMPLPEEKLNHGSFAASQAREPLLPAGRRRRPRAPGRRCRSPARRRCRARRRAASSELVVGPEQVDLDALHHLRDAEVGDPRERLLAEPEEVQVGDVAEVEELEVVLARPVGRARSRGCSSR